MPDALPVAMLPIYLGLRPVWGTAGFSPVTLDPPCFG